MSMGYRLLRAFSFVRCSGKVQVRKQNEQYNWVEAFADAFIVAGMQFFYTLAGLSVAQIVASPIKALIAAGISAGLGFFTTLAIKRGIRTNPNQ
ncbi:MAG: hypothetical protein GXO43_03230 [Crenarchaeota archaeon]|nr:hypothetical protein [Thermoproteota archaeon]